MQPPTAPPLRLLITRRELFAALALTPRTGARMLAAGNIGPEPIAFSRRSIRFDAGEVQDWIARRRPDGTLFDRRDWQAYRRAQAERLRARA